MSEAPQGGVTCDCWAATMQIIRESKAPFIVTDDDDNGNNGANSATTPQIPGNTMPLDNMLALGRRLVQHWELLNGCPSSAAHLAPVTLRFMTDAIGAVLALYDIATDRMQLRVGQGASASGLSSFFSTPGSTVISASEHSFARGTNNNTPPTYLGSLRLDDDGEHEAAIVAQEALRHSVIQLGVMLQDIEEETSQYGPAELSDMEQPLKAQDIKKLITRLFRLLGRLNAPDVI
ncbi:hypothetical protein Daus18300_000225 [Diaporthe australafricana]|uniref:Uncharacterized protein n=1 Tax=Diaporthe australafricana TaxID=127596 RepID=A0ABR3Y5U0_9PEZI